MGNYVHDWQPQWLDGVPGSRFYDAGHADANGHNHFGFRDKDKAREVVNFLRSRGITATEWAGDQGARIGRHQDPGHYDGRSFDVPASQWSPNPDSKKEIAGMQRVNLLMSEFLHGKGVPASVLDSSFRPTAAVGAEDSTGEQAAFEPAPVADWRAAASAADRNTDPGSAGYWQREDMKQWAAANPALAKATMARYGADASALTPASTPAPTPAPTPASTPAPTPAPAPTPTPTPNPPDRGALNGTQVGRRAPLQPYAFEIHADASADAGGKTGFIGSYLDKDNPLFQSLNRVYGNYGPNNSRQWRGGDLGAPRRGLSIIETRTAGAGMNDPAQHQATARQLLQTFLGDADVKAGRRQLHLFVGHGDTDNPAAQGAAGGDAKESVWNTGVFNSLRRLAQEQKLSSLVFHDPVIANEDDNPQANWNRALRLRQQWQQQQAGGQ
jgi:hypothetical protein